MLSTSQRAPGYRFQYQVPPTPDAASITLAVNPVERSLWSMYRPAKPAPTITASRLSLFSAKTSVLFHFSIFESNNKNGNPYTSRITGD